MNAEMIKAIRTSHSLTRPQFANALGVPVEKVVKWERVGVKKPFVVEGINALQRKLTMEKFHEFKPVSIPTHGAVNMDAARNAVYFAADRLNCAPQLIRDVINEFVQCSGASSTEALLACLTEVAKPLPWRTQR